MTSLERSLRLSHVHPQPWRNGGGKTRELLVWPNAADWSVRVSVADIEQDGPFSAFPGIERYFAVLVGEGVELEGVGTVRNGDSPVSFDGDIARDCKLLSGSTRDLNVMIRRNRGRGKLQRIRAEDDLVVARDAAVHGLLSLPADQFVWSEGSPALNIGNATDEALFYFAYWHHPEVLR